MSTSTNPSTRRLATIDCELRRCTHEMQRLATEEGGDAALPRTTMGGGMMVTRTGMMDPELLALEAEVCADGNRGMTGLGARYTQGAHDTRSLQTTEDSALDLAALQHMVSCLSGNMYDTTKGMNVTFQRSERKVRREEKGGDKDYTLITHWTNNKEAELCACSISVFQGDAFVAYLFSTNDLLQFDNFNCYRGQADPYDCNAKPELKCVEQLVFCENKVQINLKTVLRLGHSKLFEEAAQNTWFGFKLFIQVLRGGKSSFDAALNERIKEIEAEWKTKTTEFKQSLDRDPIPFGKEREEAIQRNENLLANTAKQQLVALLRASRPNDHTSMFYDAYKTYFESKLMQEHDLLPLKSYKFVGRGLCAAGTFTDTFDRCSLLCAMSARMTQLRNSPLERSLVSALVPACVAECSKDDGLWGYKVSFEKNSEKKLTWLAEGNDDTRLFQIIDDANKFQEYYIKRLSEFIGTDASSTANLSEAEKLLFQSNGETVEFRIQSTLFSERDMDNSVHRLGLSEHILQSLWTRRITFPPDLISRIQERLGLYGITYDHYIPSPGPAHATPLEIMRSIGHEKVSPLK